MDYKIMGERLKKARQDKNLKQKDIANSLGVTTAFVSRVENGSSHVNLKSLYELCSFLGISDSCIFSGVNEVNDNYLNSDFKDLLNKCTTEKRKLIYEIAKTIISTTK